MTTAAEGSSEKLDRNAAGPTEDASAPGSGIPSPAWTRLISDEEWGIYDLAIRSVRAAGVRFMLGGAFGLAAYTGRWRNTKDLDLYVLPADRELAINAIVQSGFTDYHEKLPYDRGWIYRGMLRGVIVDIIWGTPNRRSEVDPQWLAHARQLAFRTEILEVVPAEELAWIKLYVLQRDRSDWADVINLLYATSAQLDWTRLIQRLADDVPLLHGLLSVFAWLCPDRVENIPPQLRKQAGVRKPRTTEDRPNLHRIKLLDSRPWFAALEPPDKPMQL